MDAYDGAEAIERAWRDGLKPDPLLTVSEWADRHRVLSQRASSEPGRWRTARTPYLKEIMDCLSPSSPYQRVAFMKGAQVGGSECGNNFLAYVIHQAPGPMMAVAPTVELAKRNSKQRIDPLIEESEVLRERVKERRSRDSGNTVLSKEFPGGVLILTGANSAVGLRSMPARYLFLDEVDGYPGDVEGEGDPILLAERRSATFQRRKILLVSTPKTKGLSRIEREYEASDQRRFFVPCPHCGEHQTLEFENLRWPEGRPREAEYACRHCDAPIGERHKTWMLEHGAWRPTGESDGRTAGFHLSSLYSPVGWFSWADAAEMYDQARKTPDLMKGFVNTVLGQPFEDEAEAPEWQRLYERREPYRIGTVPETGLFLTAGVDVQKDRLEVEIVAWGRSKETWSVDYRVIGGDTARAEVWSKLDAVLARDWPHASGHTLPIRVMCVDAGYATQDVYAWVRQHPQASWGPAGAAARQPRTAVAVKGRDRDTALLLSVSKADAGVRRRGLRVWSVGTPVAKGELYRWLKLEWPTEEALADGTGFPPGACHFPQYGEEYFKQLTAERLVTRIVKGFPRASWEKEPGRRNEALDCRVQALAARAMFEAGECCFFRFRPRRPEDGLTVPLQLQMLSAEHLPLAKTETLPNGNEVVFGIELDRIGRRVAYHFHRTHPGDVRQRGQGELVRVPAEQVLHVFHPIAEGQIRGVPWVAPAMVRLWLLDQYDDAELDRKKVAAMFAGVVTRPGPDDVMGEDSAAKDADGAALVGLQPGTMQLLLPGEDIKFSDPADVGGTYESFQYRTLLACCAAMGMPYTNVTGDLRQANYSSLREGKLEFRRRIEQFQHGTLIYQLCRPVWNRWLRDAVLAGALDLPGFADNPAPWLAVKWIPPKWDWVDPLKDRKAEIEAIQAGLKSRSDVIESEGYDAEEVDRRIAADRAREAELGLNFSRPGGRQPAIPEEPDADGAERPSQSEEQAA